MGNKNEFHKILTVIFCIFFQKNLKVWRDEIICKKMKIKCSRCQHKKEETDFVSIRGGKTKMCVHCRQQNNKSKKCKFHNKTECRLCGDGKQIKIKRMVYNSKKHDMKLNRYDANNHVDYCFIEQLMDESMNCSICNRNMQLITTNVSLCSLMQKSLKVGFSKSNCVLGCFDCKTSQQGCGTDDMFELYKEKNNYKTKNKKKEEVSRIRRTGEV